MNLHTDTCRDPAYLTKLLRRVSAYLNGDECLTNRQVEHLARTLKFVSEQIDQEERKDPT